MQFKINDIMGSDDQLKALRYLKKKFNTKTAYELYRILEKLSGIMRKESQKESATGSAFKSEFSADIPPEADALLNKD